MSGLILQGSGQAHASELAAACAELVAQRSAPPEVRPDGRSPVEELVSTLEDHLSVKRNELIKVLDLELTVIARVPPCNEGESRWEVSKRCAKIDECILQSRCF